MPESSRSRTGIPASDRETIQQFCDQFTPVEHLHEMRVECDVRGKSVTILECRPPWTPERGPDWERKRIAQLRFDPDSRRWSIYWADRNSRWLVYPTDPVSDVTRLLIEIEDDPMCLFWG